MTETAACSCGQLSIACAGEPVRVSVCHCLACKTPPAAPSHRRPSSRRTAAPRLATRRPEGERGEDGLGAVFHFCPTCGSPVFWRPKFLPDRVAVAIGASADPGFPPPDKQVYAESAHRG